MFLFCYFQFASWIGRHSWGSSEPNLNLCSDKMTGLLLCEFYFNSWSLFENRILFPENQQNLWNWVYVVFWQRYTFVNSEKSVFLFCWFDYLQSRVAECISFLWSFVYQGWWCCSQISSVQLKINKLLNKHFVFKIGMLQKKSDGFAQPKCSKNWHQKFQKLIW